MKKLSDFVEDLLFELKDFGLKDGDTVYVKSWTPNKGWYWDRQKLEYNHPVWGVYPNLVKDTNERCCVLHNDLYIKKSRSSKFIFNFKF
jgi:hypothetical protein